MKILLGILLFVSSCSQKNSNKQILNALAALSLNLPTQASLVETRPFRGRTLVLLEANNSIVVYDWQRERFVEKSSQSDELSGVSEIYASEYGRYAYAKVGNQFRILDIGLNLSPHLDHFHYERSLDYSVISNTKINLSAPPSTIPFRAYSKDGWTLFSYTISCTNYNTVVHTQIPSPNANFQQLESGYNKIHYVLISCGNIIHVVRHNDDTPNSTSYFQLNTGSKEIKFLEPLFWNSNIDRGGKDVKPIFIGNTAQNLENSFFMINAETNSFQEVLTRSYFYKHIGTEKRTGKYIYILSNDGYIYSYGRENLQETGKTYSELPYSTQLEFRTSWNAGFILRENEIHEYNLTERQKTRVVTTTSKTKQDSFHEFYGPGSDYE